MSSGLVYSTHLVSAPLPGVSNLIYCILDQKDISLFFIQTNDAIGVSEMLFMSHMLSC